MSPDDSAAASPTVTPADAPAAVLAERRENVLLITLNRPEGRKAVNAALAAGGAGGLDQLDEGDSLLVGVLTGGGGFFFAGVDPGGVVSGGAPGVGGPRLPG